MINYQGILYDPSAAGGAGAPVTGTQQVEFRIYDSLTGGTPIWGRRFPVSCSEDGVFNAMLSDGGTSLGGATNSLPAVFTGKNRYLELTVQGHGSAISPRQQLPSAPYAMQSAYAVEASSASKGFTIAGGLTLTSGGATVNGATTLKNGLSVASGGMSVMGMTTLSNGLLVIGNTTNKGTLTVTNGLIVKEPATITGYGTVPIGGLILWSGASTAIPDGWALCNGTTNNGHATPDLRNRFLVGAGGTYNVADTGGVDSVTLTVAQMPAHTHVNGDYRYLMKVDGTYTAKATDSTTTEPDLVHVGEMASQGGGQSHENRPPYYALCYIMRVK